MFVLSVMQQSDNMNLNWTLNLMQWSDNTKFKRALLVWWNSESWKRSTYRPYLKHGHIVASIDYDN